MGINYNVAVKAIRDNIMNIDGNRDIRYDSEKEVVYSSKSEYNTDVAIFLSDVLTFITGRTILSETRE